MKFKNIKQFLVFLLIDFLFIFCIFTFVRFMFNKVKDYILSLQGLNLDLQSMGETILENASNLNLNLLGVNLEVINQIIQKIMYYLLYTLLGIFLLYCMFQAVQWNLNYNNLRFKKFGRYLLRFILINIPIFLILGFIFYEIMYNLRGVVLGSWITETYLENQFSFAGSLPMLIIWIILFLVAIYFTINIYILMNKYKLKDTLLKSLHNLKNYKLLLRFFCYIVVMFLVLFAVRINVILGLVLILSLIQIFRMDFSKLIK